MPRPRSIGVNRRVANAAAVATLVERMRLQDLEALKQAAQQERSAHAERIARLLDNAGYTEAAAYVRQHGGDRSD